MKELLFALDAIPHLYSGMPVESLNQSTMLILSLGEGGVTSHGSSAFVPLTAQTTWAGTATQCTCNVVVFTCRYRASSGTQ
jgi:hypothetical protein